jgi:hypothetical protein
MWIAFIVSSKNGVCLPNVTYQPQRALRAIGRMRLFGTAGDGKKMLAPCH